MRTSLAVALSVPLLAACGGADGAGGDGPDVGDEYGAQVMCESFVEDRLKAPSSAEFDTSPGEQDGKAWVVEGSVDSENGFGAMLRSDFTCRVKYLGNDEWRLVELTGLN